MTKSLSDAALSGDIEAEHTPTPWFTDGAGRQEHGAIGIFHEDGVACVALIQPGCLPAKGREDAAKANARFIVRACNAHDELVAALETAEHFLVNALAVHNMPTESALDQIRTALDKAREG